MKFKKQRKVKREKLLKLVNDWRLILKNPLLRLLGLLLLIYFILKDFTNAILILIIIILIIILEGIKNCLINRLIRKLNNLALDKMSDKTKGEFVNILVKLKEHKAHLQVAIGKLMNYLTIVSLIVSLVVALISWHNSNGNWDECLSESILSGISVVVATLPIELPIILLIYLIFDSFKLLKVREQRNEVLASKFLFFVETIDMTKVLRYILTIFISLVNLSLFIPLLKLPKLFTPIHSLILKGIIFPASLVIFYKLNDREDLISKKQEKIDSITFNKKELLLVILQGLFISVTLFLSYFILIISDYSALFARTFCFITLIFINLLLISFLQSDKFVINSFVDNYRNRIILGINIGIVIILILLVNSSLLREIIEISFLSIEWFFMAIGLALFAVLPGEFIKRQ